MPELPEVETVCRGLSVRLTGRRFAKVLARRKDLRFPLPEHLAARLTGRRVLGVRRRAKYILVELDDGTVMLAHLGMSGRMTIGPPGQAPGKHDHVVFETDDGATLMFNDARRFGMIDLVEGDALENHKLLRDLGPEPLGNAFSGPVLSAALAGKRTPIKAALLDQGANAAALLARREAVLALARERVASGLDTPIGLREAEAAEAESRGSIAALRSEAAAARNQLAALAGRGPDRTIDLVPAFGQVADIADLALPSQLPADLVGRRPDVAALRQRIQASGRDIESARAAFYPNINLAAYVGLQSIGLSQLLNTGSAIFGVGPALRLPLFGSARLTSGLAARNAERDALVEQYNERVLEALREIVDLVAASDAMRAQQAEAQRAVQSGAEALRLARVREQAGLTGRLPVLESEARQLEREQRLAGLRSQRLELRVALVRALGGGFDPAAGEARAIEIPAKEQAR